MAEFGQEIGLFSSPLQRWAPQIGQRPRNPTNYDPARGALAAQAAQERGQLMASEVESELAWDQQLDMAVAD